MRNGWPTLCGAMRNAVSQRRHPVPSSSRTRRRHECGRRREQSRAARRLPGMYPETDIADSPVSRIVARLVLAYAPTANDPEVSGRIGILESACKRLNRIVELTARWLTVNAEHRDASGFHRVKAQRIGEIGVKAYKKSSLADAHVEEALICRAGQSLLEDGRHVVPRRSERRRDALTQVLVEFDPHATSTKGPEARRAP